MRIEFDYAKLGEAVAAAVRDIPQAIDTHFSVATVAERLDCTQGHIRGLIQAGELQAVNLAASESTRAALVIPRRSLEEFLKRRQVAVGAQK